MNNSKRNFYVPVLMDLSAYHFERSELEDEWNTLLETIINQGYRYNKPIV